jgi:hypothetical protein
MKRILSALLGWLALQSGALSQTATDPNEGSRLISLGNSNFQFTWWARAGRSYLVDVSDDLYSWTYLDTVIVGLGGVSPPINFNVSSERFFVRLNTDPFNTDADGDGMPDGWEVLFGLNARFAGDASLDPDDDGLTNLDEFTYGFDPWIVDETAGAARELIYDERGWLETVTALPGGALGVSYSYDEEGNILGAGQ